MNRPQTGSLSERRTGLLSERRLHRAIFIRAGESGSVTALPQGRYRLRFQLGTDWLPGERRFCQLSGTSEFDESFTFKEVESEQGTKYTTFEVTLHAVFLGTARTHAIPESMFELPPL